jgi:23S rRNA pseudouridine2605 synthase
MLNKPRGLVTTAEDEMGRATVYDCLRGKELPWVAPVGRLDKASEGLLLFTNDTPWAAKVMNPGAHLDKIYHVQIDCLAGEDLLESITRGIPAKEGGLLKAKRVRRLRQGKRNSWLEVVLDEGKNRHIRRLLSSLGVNVLRLIRVAIGPLELGNLPKGEVRPLTEAERLWLIQAGEKD